MKKVKKFLAKYIHEIYHYENGKYEFKGRESLVSILILMVMSHFQKICCLFFILNQVINCNLISLVYPLSLFFYALIENPIPQKSYWKFMIYYTIIIISAKFIYQLPLFCGTPAYSIFHYDGEACYNFNINPSDLINRIDFIIGIRKYSGNSSYPKNQGFFIGVLIDYLVLLCLLIQRYI